MMRPRVTAQSSTRLRAFSDRAAIENIPAHAMRH
jgi:hypothetical protein